MKLKQYKTLPYPQNLWSAVLGEVVLEKSLPEDWETTLEHVLAHDKDRTLSSAILLFFKDGLTLAEIADHYGFSREYVRQSIDKSIRWLRKPAQLRLMIYGLKRVQQMKDSGLGFQSEDLGQVGNSSISLSTSIEDLDLSVRSWNCLKRGRIDTVGQLLEHSEEELLQIRNMGQISMDEIKNRLAEHNFVLGKTVASAQEPVGPFFRGKWKSSGDWQYGGFHSRYGKSFIISIDKKLRIDGVEVYPETVCQYIGKRDRKGRKIFSKDIVKHFNHSLCPENFRIGVIEWDDKKFRWILRDLSTEEVFEIWENCDYEVIGNLYDTPELLETCGSSHKMEG